MAFANQPHRLPIRLENLEHREMLSASPFVYESFQRETSQGLPVDWSSWSNDSSLTTFDVIPRSAGHGDSGLLLSTGRSTTTARTWSSQEFSADLDVSASVFLNSVSPLQLFLRGSELDSNTPNYYAASVVRGTEVQLLRVNNGVTSVLGSVKSTDWVSNRWVTLRISAEGDHLRVSIHRGDTNQYMNSEGRWTREPVYAIEREDQSITGSGFAGIARPARVAGEIQIDDFQIRAPEVKKDFITEERFNGTPTAVTPSGWENWSSSGKVDVAVRSNQTLQVTSRSNEQIRLWQAQPVPVDSQVTTSIYVDSLIPAGVFNRGSNIDTATPTYYGVNISRGLNVELVRVQNGESTTLGTLNSTGWQSGIWVQVSLITQGQEIYVQVFRTDTGRYLNSQGQWTAQPSWAMNVTDDAIRTGGLAGLTRNQGYAGNLSFDHLLVNRVPADLTYATTIPKVGTLNGDPTPPAPSPEPEPVPTPAPVSPPPTITPEPNPAPIVPAPPSPSRPPVVISPELPAIPQNFDWIRVANLAYQGTPMTSFERTIIQDGIDLVIPNLSFVDTITEANPDTPQFIYTNISNIYLSLLTDWLEFADSKGYDREDAFFHVNKATPFQGLSASAVPVDRFWAIYRGNETQGWTDFTRGFRVESTPVSLASVDQSVAIGYTEKYREINFNYRSNATAGWGGVLEYVSKVNAQGEPIEWKTLSTLTDTSNQMRQSGRVTFEPPADWVTASIGGSARYYYTRIRTTNAGIAPVVNTILGRDYALHDGNKGTIPAFDYNADRDNDGYLNESEFQNRREGFDARFVYESRITFPYYGPNRFATNVFSPEYQEWVIDYHQRFLEQQPNIAGFFVDNSTGRLPIDPSSTIEDISSYATSYGETIGALNAALSPKWVIANTAGGGRSVDSQIQNGVTYLEEFALRPQSANYVMFEDMAATVQHRRELSNGNSYEILDSLPTQLDAADPRTMTSTLAMYYLVADPNLTFLMINGGNEPASSWTRHWTEAIRYDVGAPTNTWSQVAQGQDPSNSRLEYRVYGREYENALVLYKPLSYIKGTSGTIADNTATVHQLNGTYREVRADGTLGPAIRQISLRNGEGVILAKA